MGEDEMMSMTTGTGDGDSDSRSSRADSHTSEHSASNRNGGRGGSIAGADEPSSKRARKSDSTKIIQVANIAPQTTKEQMQTLFGYLGKIDDIRLYPTIDLGMTVSSKICFVKFYDSASVGVSQHLTNTVFIDRALVVIPCMEGDIPDEQKGLELLGSGTLLPGIADPKLPQHVTSQLEGLPPHQVVATNDPKLTEANLPRYPVLPTNYDTRKIEEIRRTILIANLDPEVTPKELLDHFNQAGEVKYFRQCNRDNDPLSYALIEYSDQPSILEALKFNGTRLGNTNIK